jgi:hypothetical protein
MVWPATPRCRCRAKGNRRQLTGALRPKGLVVLLLACGGRPGSIAPLPSTAVRVLVSGPAEWADSGVSRVSAKGRGVVVSGVTQRMPGAGVYGDVDLSALPTLRLTLYDSLPGRPITPAVHRELVAFEATLGPLAPGEYEVIVGRFDAAARLIVVEDSVQRLRVGK